MLRSRYAEQSAEADSYQVMLGDLSFVRRESIRIIKESGIDDPALEQLLENPMIIERLAALSSLAYQIVRPPAILLNDRAGKIGSQHAQEQFEQAVFNFYALTTSYVGRSPAITKSAEWHTGLANFNRHQDIVWTSQEPEFTVLRDHLSDEYLHSLADGKEKDYLNRMKEDIDRWFGPAGLLLHTAVASWGIEATVRKLSEFVENKSEKSKWADYLLKIPPAKARAWLNLHDLGRLVTHHPSLHADCTFLIARLAKLPSGLFRDYDLPTILQFDQPNTMVGEFSLPERQENESAKDYQLRAQLSRRNYINLILSKIEQVNQETGATDNPVAVLLFWLVDSFTKLYDVRTKEPMAALKGSIDSKQVKQKFGHYANLQPGDHDIMFLSRAKYRQRTNGVSSKDDAIIRYYQRQYQLAESIFVWLEEELQIPSQLLWQLVFDFTEVTDRYLDQNGIFQYTWINNDISPWSKVE